MIRYLRNKNNIILIILDTLRKDYGEKYITSILEKYGFVYYPNAIAPAPWTIPSHASIFTGLYPAYHGAHETKEIKSDKVRLKYDNILTRKLKSLGYSTYLLSANIFVTPYFGFSGFDQVLISTKNPPSLISRRDSEKLQEYSSGKAIKTALELMKHKEFSLLLRAGIQKTVLSSIPVLKIYSLLKKWPLDLGISEFVERLRSLNFTHPAFVAINLMEMHEPYPTLLRHGEINYHTLKNWAGTFDERVVQRYVEGYNMEIKYLSQKLHLLLGMIKNKGIFENSLIIITSDHGQLLGDHNKINHGTFLYDELIRVPLWIKFPYNTDVTRYESENEYISLTKLYDLILCTSKGHRCNDSILYSPVVFSEVYGIHLKYTAMPLSQKEKTNIMNLEKYRIAIYYKNFKGIFNVIDWKFEEIKSYDPNIEVTEDVVKHMKKEVLKFLKTATVAKVPKIKL